MTPADSRRDRRAARVATLAAVGVIAQQVGGKATRDAIFLSNFDVSVLPKVMAVGAGLSILAVTLVSRQLARHGPARVIPVALILNAAFFGLWHVLYPDAKGPVAIAVYLHMAVLGSVVISGFWSVVNERFDPHTAKREVARIGVGATLGGLLGGAIAERVGGWFGVPTTLLVLAGLSLASAAAVAAVGPPPHRRTPQAGARESVVTILGQSPYLRRIAALVLVTAVVAALLDFALKAEAQQELRGEEALVGFFAVFYTTTGVLTFVLQLTLSRRSLSQLGLGGTLAVLPLLVLGLGALGTVFTRLWAVVALRGGETVLANSFFRSGYELLYTPVAPAKKRPTKAFIDVGFDRLGDAVGSAIVLGMLALAPSIATRAVVLVAIGGASFSLWIVSRLHQGYVDQLADSLRTGSVALSDAEVVDATTRRTLAETTMALDREKLLSEIRALREQGEAMATDEISSPGDALAPEPQTPLLATIADVTSSDPERVRSALARRPVDPALVPHLVPLLAQDPLARHVIDALRAVAPRVVGQLVDALLDPELPLEVRRRLPRVLRTVDDPRAALGLFDGLSDDRFEVRFRCGRALSVMLLRHPHLAIARERVLEVALREVEVGQKVWESRLLLEGAEEDDENPFGEVLAERMSKSLEHVFTVLSLTLDRDTMRIAVAALSSEDKNLRGTALEYLENILPEKIRRGLWPYVAGGHVTRPSRRSRQEIVDELLRSMDSLRIDRDKLLDR